MNKHKPNSVFTLQLKLFEKIFKVQVFKSDDKKTLIERVCKQNDIPQKFHDKIQQKIMNSLNKLVGSDSVPQALLEKVIKFVSKDGQQLKKYIQNCPESIIKSLSQQRQINQVGQNKQQQKQNRLLVEKQIYTQDLKNVNCVNQPPKQQNIIGVINKQELKNNQISTTQKLDRQIQARDYYQKQELDHIKNLKNKLFDQKTAKKKLNQNQNDLLKAYKNVYSRCKNPEFKQKTRQYIDQLKFGNICPKTTKENKVIQFKNSQSQSNLLLRQKYFEKDKQLQQQQQKQQISPHFQYSHHKSEIQRNFKTLNSNQSNSNFGKQITNICPRQDIKRNKTSKIIKQNIPEVKLIQNKPIQSKKTHKQQLLSFIRKRLTKQSKISQNENTKFRQIGKIQKKNQTQKLNQKSSLFMKSNNSPVILSNNNSQYEIKTLFGISEGIYQKQINKHCVYKSSLNHKITNRSKSLYSLTKRYNYLDKYEH